MTCAWKELLMILPPWLRQDTDSLGKTDLQELRLRINAPPELVLFSGSRWLSRLVSAEDLQYCINAASRYSPWAAETMALGYLTAPGGHRIGICGDVTLHNGSVIGIRSVNSLCIRIARDFPGCAGDPAPTGSVLILGAPGWGKTTLLRDLARKIAEVETVAVVDERGELFPEGIPRGKRMDVLSLCPKPLGIDRLLRTMGPGWICVDEITSAEDCAALIQAVGCGVKLMATAHASCRREFQERAVYRSVLDTGIFTRIMVLNRHKQWHMERVSGCV